jgi:hypothetical protein
MLIGATPATPATPSDCLAKLWSSAIKSQRRLRRRSPSFDLARPHLGPHAMTTLNLGDVAEVNCAECRHGTRRLILLVSLFGGRSWAASGERLELSRLELRSDRKANQPGCATHVRKRRCRRAVGRHVRAAGTGIPEHRHERASRAANPRGPSATTPNQRESIRDGS